jgi:hypothetical protein
MLASYAALAPCIGAGLDTLQFAPSLRSNGGTQGKRISRYVTVKGKRQDAQRELTRLLGAADAGTLPEPSKATVAEHLHAWLDGNTHGLAPKTLERYRELADQQIIPRLGCKVM